MSRIRALVQKGGAALLDQAMLSLANLLIALILIKFAPKEEYAVYILLFTPILLAMGLQNALLNSPFTTLYGQANGALKINYSTSLFYGHLLLTAALFILSILGLSVYSYLEFNNIDWLLVFSFSFAILGVLAREAIRAFYYSKKDTISAFTGDLWYVLLMALSISILLFSADMIKASNILMIMGMSGLIPSIFQYFFNSKRINKPETLSLIEFWSLGKWALQGVILSWVNINSYPYLTAVIFSVAAVADIAASRLFWMPIALMMAAWSTLFRPYIAEWFSTMEFEKIQRISYRSIVLGIVVFMIYFSLLLLFYPLIDKYFLNEDYDNLILLAGLWGGFFLIQFIRSVLMASLMVNEYGYKKLSLIAWIGLLTMVALVPLLILNALPISSIIGLLIFTELIQVFFILSHLKSFWQPAGQYNTIEGNS